MSYIYRLKDGADVEKFKELGFEYLPPELYGSEEENNILYKIVKQPSDGACVQSLINFYNSIANRICSDRMARRAHVKMGIRYRYCKGKYRLSINPDLIETFSLWRIEIDFEMGDVYFTISDGNLPRFYDADLVMDKYCKEEIELLRLNDLIERIELTKVQ